MRSALSAPDRCCMKIVFWVSYRKSAHFVVSRSCILYLLKLGVFPKSAYQNASLFMPGVSSLIRPVKVNMPDEKVLVVSQHVLPPCYFSPFFLPADAEMNIQVSMTEDGKYSLARSQPNPSFRPHQITFPTPHPPSHYPSTPNPPSQSPPLPPLPLPSSPSPAHPPPPQQKPPIPQKPRPATAA